MYVDVDTTDVGGAVGIVLSPWASKFVVGFVLSVTGIL